MSIKVGLILILLLAKATADEPIIWNKEKRLSWNDFQATAPKLDSHIALSRVEIQYESQVDKAGRMTMDIKGVFIKEQSWVKQDRKSDNILKHEQYHFNLTELWARKLRREVASKKWNTKTFEKEFTSLFKKHMAQTLKEQLRYDNETNHSQVSDKQKEWERNIDQELVELKAHAAINVPFLFE
ncbi:MAG TPA: hypothetical protein DIS90_02135 [Cytophagales bacterium]|nr:hypothetical protein [Cytophagales bacterium]